MVNAGAAFTTTRTPASQATRTAVATVATGISNWVTSTRLRRISRPAGSSISASELAPGTTRMVSSPEVWSTIVAMPVGLRARRTQDVSMPSSAIVARSARPRASSPTLPMNAVVAPERAAPTAWLSP